MQHRSISQRLSKTKSLAIKKEILEDWVNNWESELINSIKHIKEIDISPIKNRFTGLRSVLALLTEEKLEQKILHPTPEQIREARNAAGLTQAQAATLLHKGKDDKDASRYWQQWEAGKYKLDPALWELFLIKIKRSKNNDE